ncbi:hypothetical protein EDI_123210 [Entamoeba dispar SAW760]|uniref:TLDc domain-containing protein n=1 Tax=Entamoeba dispar (strain ATCC PRA-260 / SAW760) TaxID=370354 RepID=B0ER07_ENTDS|nr:uncharacterized protein EDI_123210 [Entamoeba dispar SAW760]EDR23016.1 hypothetical protein EDI_123210 [Entamoeba dispar SAW760]|eukprot:EDR23016.1 hypothetical protein EDI_123210 [Entamoeba dispar SAW760]
MENRWWDEILQRKEEVEELLKQTKQEGISIEQLEQQNVNNHENDLIDNTEEILNKIKWKIQLTEEKISKRNVILQHLKEGVNKIKRINQKQEDEEIIMKEITNDIVRKLIFIEENKYKEEIKEIESKCQEMINKRKEEFQLRRTELNNMKFIIPKKIGIIPFKLKMDKELRIIGEHYIYLQNWCNLNECQIVFDSSHNSHEQFNYKIMNKPNLYFINFDEFGYVFGAFVSVPIHETNKFISDPNHFIFSLKKSTFKPMKWNPIGDNSSNALFVYKNESYLYQVGHIGCFIIHQTGVADSYCKNLQIAYLGAPSSLSNTDSFEDFSVTRVVVIQMM